MKKDDRETTDVFLFAREALYALLHRTLGSEPDGDLVRTLASEESRMLLSLVPSNEDERQSFGRFFEALDETVLDCENDPNKTADKMKDDFTALFLGPAQLDAPPWESYYRSREGSFLSKYTLSARKAYREQGFAPAEYPNEPDDHLAYELDFMRALAARTLIRHRQGKGIEALRNAQMEFLEDHLLRWAGSYAQAMQATERQSVYPHLAGILWTTLKWDARSLAGIPL